MALGAYVIWGLLPLYMTTVRALPAVEFVAWRIVWTLPFCFAILAVTSGWADLRAALGDSATRLRLVASAGLIAINWVVFTAAVNSGHVFAAALGYYMNPLVNVALGTLVLKERLNARQWIAVGLATAGVAVLAFGAREMLAVSLSLALSFGIYGLIRKTASVAPLPGLTIETLILLPAALAVAAWYASGPSGSGMAISPSQGLLVALGGVLTGTPLLLFAGAARRMDYSSLGMIQFLSPTISFVLALTVFGEELRPAQLICFMLIWSAIALFVWDLIVQRRSAAA